MRAARNLTIFALFVSACVALGSGSGWAQSVSLRLIPFQARLTDSSGAALNGVYNVKFVIYDASTGGTAQWVETHPNTSIVGGQLSVYLGSLRSLDDVNGDNNPNDPVDFGANAATKFVGITIGTGTEMVPRHQLVPAFHARGADIASSVRDGGVTSVMIAPGAVTADKILDGSIGPADLQTVPFITGANISPASLATAQLQDGAVTGSKLDPALLASLNANSGTLSQILNVQIETRKTAWLKDYKGISVLPQTMVVGPPGNIRVLNTIEGDNSIVSLTGGSVGVDGTANNFILQPGTYEVEAWAPAVRTQASALRIINVATGSPIIDFQQNGASVSNDGVSPNMLSGEMVLAATTTLALVQRIGALDASNAGFRSNFGSNELYAVLKIVKVDRRTIAQRIANP